MPIGSDGISRADIKVLRVEGFIQEINRRYLHPLGLALEVEIMEDGSERLGGIWDYRDDPEGILFDEVTDAGAAIAFSDLLTRKNAVRVARFGWSVQPAGVVVDID